MLRVLNCTLAITFISTSLAFSALEPVRADLVLTASVAGQVADSDDDNLGDNSAITLFILSAVNSSGGPGADGTVRTQTEWNISSLNLADIGSANVVLTTSRTIFDSLDTQFYVGNNNQDGIISNSDFQAPVTLIPGAVMPVSAGTTGMPVSFEFDVTSFLQNSVQAGHTYFSVQGRVNESLADFGRGLRFYGVHPNTPDEFLPQLVISTAVPEASTVLVWSLLALGCVTLTLVRRRDAS